MKLDGSVSAADLEAGTMGGSGEAAEAGGTETTAAPVALDKTPQDTPVTSTRDNVLPDDHFDKPDDWDDKPLYPDGYKEGDKDSPFFPQDEEDPLGVYSKQGEAPPSTDADKTEPESPVESETEEAQPPVPETPEEPDYKALWEKAEDDRKKAEYRRVYNEQINKMMTPEAAAMIASNAVGGKTYPLEDAPEEAKESTTAQSPAPADFAKDLETLTRLYPDAAKPGEGIPLEVMREYRNGTPLLTAYSAHRAKTDAKTIASLQKEVATLRQIQKNQEQAVIRGTTGGSAVKEEPDDPFLRGLREDW